MTATSHSSNVRAALFVAAAVLLFTLEATVVRGLGGRMPLAEILTLRAIGQLLFVLPWMLRLGIRAVAATDRPAVHLLRGTLSLATWWFYYYSIVVLPLAMSTVLSFANVLFAVALAAPLLKERVGRARWIATIAGFAGIVIAMQPIGGGELGAMAAGLFAAALGGGIILTTRYLSSRESPFTIMLYIGLITCAGTIPVAATQASTLVMAHPVEMLVLVLLGPLGMYLLIRGYELGEASAIAPTHYVRLLFAAVLGWVVFDERPSAALYAGGALVIASVLFLTLHERRKAGARAAAGPAAD